MHTRFCNAINLQNLSALALHALPKTGFVGHISILTRMKSRMRKDKLTLRKAVTR